MCGSFYEQTVAEERPFGLPISLEISLSLETHASIFLLRAKKRNDTHRLCHVANLVLLPLADDQPDHAEKELSRLTPMLSNQTVGFHHFLAFLGQKQIHLYRGNASAALEFDKVVIPTYASKFNQFNWQEPCAGTFVALHID